jgi:hypothetical protein
MTRLQARNDVSLLVAVQSSISMGVAPSVVGAGAGCCVATGVGLADGVGAAWGVG